MRKSWAGAALFFFSLFFLSASWAFATPPGSAPDEPDHYVRALAAAQGQLLGRPVETSLAQFQSSPVSQIAEGSTRLSLVPFVRAVQIPSRLVPGNIGCTAFQPLTTGDCYIAQSRVGGGTTWVLTRVGTYPPLYYVLVGLPMLLAPDTTSAVLVGRLFSGLVGVALVTAAFLILLRRIPNPAALAGFALACSPLVVFSISTIGPSAWELASALVLGAVISSLAATTAPVGKGEWVIVGVSGALLGASRGTGPMFVGMALGLATAALGPKKCIAAVRDGGHWALFAIALTFAGTLFTGLWDMVDVWHDPLNLPLVASNLGRIFATTPVSLIQQVGVFGWLDTPLPRLIYPLWISAAVSLVIVACFRRPVRQALVLIGLCGLVAAMPLVIWTTTYSNLPFPSLEGRWYMVVTIWLLIFSGAALAGRVRVAGLVWRLAWIGASVFWLAIQGVAWQTNATRYAVGREGRADFWNHSLWQPELGWGVWIAVTCLALLGLLGLAIAWTRGRAPFAPSSQFP